MRCVTTVLLVAFLAMLVIEQPTLAQGGRVVTTTLTSPALEEHRPTRRARVYLPPSYDTSNKRYPVAYYLHGTAGNQYEFFSPLVQGSQAADQLIMDGMMEEMIIVGVDGTGGQPISSFVNSELNGNFEDYIVRDLVNHIDTSFRSIASRESRGIFGASMGGYGSLLYAMRHADVFSASYSHSDGPQGFSLPGTWLYLGGDRAVFADFPNAGLDLANVQTPSDIQGMLRGLTFGWASGFSPNLDDPPLFVDLPFELPNLDIIPEVRDKWYQHDPFDLLEDHVADLSSLRGLALDVGDRDGNLLHMEAFHQKLLEAGVPHQFEVYSGGHSDKLSERILESLVFLSESLVVPLQAGDADQDRDFDQLDLVKVQIAGKYLIGQAATWGEGDWNGAPGGHPGNPPAGDGLFNQLDIVAAQQAAAYLTGPYASVQPNAQMGDGQTAVVHDSGSGESAVDAPVRTELPSINIDSASGIIIGEADESLDVNFDNDGDGNLFKAMFTSGFGTLSFGNVAQGNLSEESLPSALIVGSFAGRSDLREVDLVYVPEPSAALLLIMGAAIGLLRSRSSRGLVHQAFLNSGTPAMAHRWSQLRPLRCELLENKLCLSTLSFVTRDIYVSDPDSGGASSILAVDLDGDGDPDVVAAFNWREDRIVWYENTDGQGSFGDQQVITDTVDTPVSISAADVDGDGDSDILSAAFGDDTIAWYENVNGQGRFGPPQVINTNNAADGAYSVLAADVDGDGDTDVVSGSTGRDEIAWYENIDGNGSFGLERVVATGTAGARSIFADDIDGDGDVDVVSGTHAWYENLDGIGGFGPPHLIATAATSAHVVVGADVDGDDDVDLLATGAFSEGRVAWYENTDGRGSFGAERLIDATVDFHFGAQALHSGDLDGDGDVDAIAAFGNNWPEGGRVAWYENIDGQGTFGPREIFAIADDATSLYTADLDDDQDLDILSALPRSWYGENKIAWHENLSSVYQPGDANRDYRFDQRDIVQVLQENKYMSIFAADWETGDWNSDGQFDRQDIALALETGSYLV